LDGGHRKTYRKKPSLAFIRSTTVYRLVALAYRIGNCRASIDLGLIPGGPDWIKSDHFDIEAIIPAGSPDYNQDNAEKHPLK
jgi:uncharacterized protein (TIGR03435 family)